MTELSRPKPPRNLMTLIAFGMIGLLVALIFVVKGSDLGQSEVDQKRADEDAKATQARLTATVQDPEKATLAEFEKAQSELQRQQQEAARTKGPDNVPSMPGGSPATPQISNLELERLARAEEELLKERGRDSAAFGGPNAAGGPAPSSFVVYTAGSGKDGPGGAGGAKAGGGALPKNALVSQAEADRTGKGDLRAENERIRAQAQAEARASLPQSSGARAQGSGSGSGTANEQWLFDAQSSAVTQAKNNIVAQTSKGLYWMAPGSAINAVLLNAVNTKLPGRLSARVTQTVYDSRYGRYVVIPAGSVLTGQYRSAVEDGQDRVLMAFDTLVTPAGGTVALGNMSASDALGRGGMPGTLNTNFWERLGIATLLAVESVALTRLSPETTTSTQSGTTTGNSTEAAQIITEVAKRELDKRYSVGPYITMDAGQPMTIITTGPIEVPPIANRK